MSFLNKLVMNFSSSERLSGTSTDFLLNPNLNNFNGVKSVGLLSVEIPNSIYNILDSTNNFKIRLLKIRNQGIDWQNLTAPQSILIDFNIPAKNYSVIKLTETLTSYTANWLNTNNPGLFNVNPLIFSVDLDSYKFSVRLNPALTDFIDWGFVIPQCSIGRILGLTNLLPDSSYQNINESNRYLGAGVFTNKNGQSGEYRLTQTFAINEDNKTLSFFCKKISSPTSTYHFLLNLDVGTYSINQLVNMINSKIISQETGLFGNSVSYPTVVNGFNVSESIGIDGSIRLVFFEGFKFVNNDETKNNIEFKFEGIPSTVNFLDSIATTLNSQIATDTTSSIYNTYQTSMVGNILGFLLNTVYTTLPIGYYTDQAFLDSINAFLRSLFNSASDDWSTKNVFYSNGVITSTLGDGPAFNKIAFAKTDQYQGYKLFVSNAVNLLDRKDRIVENTNIATSLNTSLALPHINVYNNQVANVIIDLRSNDIVYLHSTIQQSPNVDGIGNSQRVLAKIPMQAPLGSTVFWQNYDHEMYRYPCSLVNMISFQLKDKYGNVVNLGGLDWSCSLVFYFDE